MKQTRIIMGMPVTIQIVGQTQFALLGRVVPPLKPARGIGEKLSPQAGSTDSVTQTIEAVFEYFKYVDEKFSTYKENSEIMKINMGEVRLEDASDDMKSIFRLADQTKRKTNGYFNIVDREGRFDPSGIVKGWAIQNAAKLIHDAGFENYYVEAGGDIQVGGLNDEGKKWAIGIKNPFDQKENVKVVYLTNQGIATSGTYIRGQHIYNPHNKREKFNDVVSLTIIGPNVYEADRFATAAFAMGRKGIGFIEEFKIQRFNDSKNEKLMKLEGYMIDSKGIATMTSGFEYYLRPLGGESLPDSPRVVSRGGDYSPKKGEQQ